MAWLSMGWFGRMSKFVPFVGFDEENLGVE